MKKGRSDNASGAKRLVVAGGGTGGHLFPAVAVAREFLTRNPGNRVLFIISGKPFEKNTLDRLGFDYRVLSAQGLKGRGRWRQMFTVLKIPGWALSAGRILKPFGPDLILGVGSYTAGPVALAAWLMGIDIVIQEQNILPGITNRSLAGLARRIYVSFEASAPAFKADKVVVSGNPVRDEILAAATPVRAPADGKSPFNILILGGSQGAHAINTAIADALPHLADRSRFCFVHQTGAADEEMVREAYRNSGIQARVAAFFNDMGRRYAEADLIVCRAGATTVAEVAIVGRGTILIPYPYAADDHQRLNALAVADRGAGEMILEKDLEGSDLASRITRLAAEPTALRAMSEKARGLGRPHAARHIVDDFYRLIQKNKGRGNQNTADSAGET